MKVFLKSFTFAFFIPAFSNALSMVVLIFLTKRATVFCYIQCVFQFLV